MMNNCLLMLLFLLIPQFLIDIFLLYLLLLVQPHNVRRIHRDTNKLFSNQVKKPAILQTGRKIASNRQILQDLYHNRPLKNIPNKIYFNLELVLCCNTLKKFEAISFLKLIEIAVYFLKKQQRPETNKKKHTHN